ncbi:multiple epidermal growth factor-like domains protein 6 isoform X2 [Latimeria chalumnae]|uniref:multiple epidermal growth factor-like domains protein 6 isoform X2 n=1 Tax=Latimeria chalumnae TaxID=7897 RepID=UPI00313E061C
MTRHAVLELQGRKLKYKHKNIVLVTPPQSLSLTFLLNMRTYQKRLYSSVLTTYLLGVAVSQNANITLSMTTNAAEISNVTVFPVTIRPFTETPVFVNCTAVNTSTCVTCLPGTYSNNGTLNCSCCSDGSCTYPEECLSCPVGHYQSQAGQQVCFLCPYGFYTNSTGSSACFPCEPGFYSNETGSLTCSRCAPGYFTSRLSATFCDPCPPGSFCNTTNCSVCKTCPGGEEAVSKASTECSPCRPGMFKHPSDSMCKICSSGYYQIKWGQETCEICPENHYCPSPDINPILCPNDAFCPAGSTAPQYCMEIFLRKSGGTCELAPLTIVLLAICFAIHKLHIAMLRLSQPSEVPTNHDDDN